MNQRKSRFLGALAVDTGGWLVANPRFHGEELAKTTMRAEAFFGAFRAMGYVALNVGEHEMVLPPQTLLKLAKRHKLQLVSANIVDKKTGKPTFQPAVLRQIGGMKVGIFGLVTAAPEALGELFAKRELAVNDPIKAAAAAVRVLRSNGAQLVICLSALRQREVDLLGEKVKGIDLVLGSASMGLTLQIAGLGDGYFADTFTKGKYNGEIVLTPGSDPKRWVAADLKASLRQQSANLRTQVVELSEQLQNADKPGSPVQLTAQSRKIMERELARMRAKQQRVDLELSGDVKTPAGAGRVRLTMHPLNSEIDDDKRVVRVIAKFKKKYPSKPGH